MSSAPRSSKRRKLNGSHSIDTSTALIGTQTRSTPRGQAQVDTSNGRRVRKPSLKTRHNGDRPSAAGDGGLVDVDMYDDIEGALEPAPRSSGRGNQREMSHERPMVNGTVTSQSRSNGRASTALRKSNGKASVGQEETESDEELDTITTVFRSAKRKTEQTTPNGIRSSKPEADGTPNEVALAPHGGRRPRRQWPMEYTVAGAQKDKSPDDEIATVTPRRRYNGFEPKWSVGEHLEMSKSSSKPVVATSLDLDFEDAVPRTIKAAKTSQLLQHHDAKQADQVTIRNIVLEKLVNRRPSPLIGLETEFKKVYQIAEQTVAAGEGNSMLIIGARGSGKTTLVNHVVAKLARDNMSDFHVIRLNGFIHTDDKLALREIWRQLGKEMEVEDDGTGKSYADTLAKLLALLSHPTELSGEHSDAVAKAVVFIMDEFDLFTSHARQTLLYNLFDIAQSRKAPIAVFGLTTRIDVAESLEKRVKSRFSHRYVHLSQARTPTAFRNMCKSALVLEAEELSFEEKAALAPAAPSGLKGKSSGKGKASSLDIWNESITRLLDDDDFLKLHVTPHFNLSKSCSAVWNALYLPLACLEPIDLPPTAEALLAFFTSGAGTGATQPLNPTAPDSKLYLLATLSTLALAMLISAARCTIIHDTDVLNFRIAYAEYSSLASKARIATASSGALAVGAGTGTRVLGRDTARSSWEELCRLGLLIPALGGDGDGREVGEKGMVKVDVALEEILPSCPGMEKAMEKWCRQI